MSSSAHWSGCSDAAPVHGGEERAEPPGQGALVVFSRRRPAGGRSGTLRLLPRDLPPSEGRRMDTPDLHQHFTKNSLMLHSLVLSWCGCGLTQACLVRGDVTAALHVLCVYDDFIVVLSFEQHKSVLHEYCRSTAGVLGT